MELNKESNYLTKKLYITISAQLYEKLRERKLFNDIDNVVSELLIKHYHLE